MASPDINTEDFMAAVDFLSKQENVDAERIGIIGICGWGGIALNAAAADVRISAQDGMVVVETPVETKVELVMPNGMSRTVTAQAGINTYPVERGICIVRAAGQVAKLKL